MKRTLKSQAFRACQSFAPVPHGKAIGSIKELKESAKAACKRLGIVSLHPQPKQNK